MTSSAGVRSATAMPVSSPLQGAFNWRNGLAYGLLGLPLAFVALPLYVILPNHYAREFGVPLATLGAILLGARLFDAVTDPLLGRLSDRLFARSAKSVLGLGAFAAVVLALGFMLLFFPLASVVTSTGALTAWASVMLVVTYMAYSVLSVSHQSWGAMLGGNETQRSQIVAWREGLGLVGVVLASVTPVALGLPATTALFFVALVVGWLAWTRAVRPVSQAGKQVLQNANATAALSGGPFATHAFAACWPSSCSTVSPVRCPPPWCCFLFRTACRRRVPWSPCFWVAIFWRPRCPSRSGWHWSNGSDWPSAGWAACF